ncbi:hypothetical protein MKW92_040419 [Papaver armeniacum]|nr:hypothetical protein MKW92_040419 [Papaver armeniacum]
MSTSSNPIDPNPASRRRTSIVVTEKKSSNYEMAAEGGTSIVSEQIRKAGETTSIGGDRDRNVSSSKGGLVKKKTVLVSTKRVPLWKTVISVLAKNFILILVLLGLVQMIRKLVFKDGGVVGDGGAVGITEFEGRIAEVEAFLKTTTKMMQVQVEIMDKKVESEISGLRREIGKKIDERGSLYESELMKLGVKTDELEKGFAELKDKGFFTKQDFDNFLEEFEKGKGDGKGKEGNEWSLDDIRGLAKEIVEKEIEKHAADGLGMVDYALGSGGGIVLDHSEPFIYKKGLAWIPFKKQFGIQKDAQIILKPSFGEPGQCFPLQGKSGYVIIKLRTGIIPEAVTVEHVSKSVAYDRASAPKDCRVSGWYQKIGTIGTSTGTGDSDLSHQGENMFTLSEFAYDLDKSNAQTFKVESGEKQVVNMVRFDFFSNHGASHTCIYRLRVHGHVPASVVKSEL